MKIVIAGDLLPYDRVATLFDQRQYERVLSRIREPIKCADYSIVNLECPICHGGEKPIQKCGPSHKCTDSIIGALQYAGFSCVTLANNHFRDYGDDGCRNTLTTLNDNGIENVGGGMNLSEAARILYKDLNGNRLAIINCCEHEFSIATDGTAGSNPLNPINQYYAIQRARKETSYVIVIVHGGHEHYQLPSPRMQETYRFFIDAGADAVINHHQHCYTGYEVYKGKPIFYGLGNFCFDKAVKRGDIWNEGYLVLLNFEKGEQEFQLIPYTQCDELPTIVPMVGEEAGVFRDKLFEQNGIIENTETLNTHFKQWCECKLAQKEIVFSPYFGSILEKLKSKGWIPSVNNSKRMLAIREHVECESHRDTTLYYLDSIV